MPPHASTNVYLRHCHVQTVCYTFPGNSWKTGPYESNPIDQRKQPNRKQKQVYISGVHCQTTAVTDCGWDGEGGGDTSRCTDAVWGSPQGRETVGSQVRGRKAVGLTALNFAWEKPLRTAVLRRDCRPVAAVTPQTIRRKRYCIKPAPFLNHLVTVAFSLKVLIASCLGQVLCKLPSLNDSRRKLWLKPLAKQTDTWMRMVNPFNEANMSLFHSY